MNTKPNTGPVSPSELAANPEALAPIREAYESFVRRAESNPVVMAAFVENPAGEFLKDAPAQLKGGFSEMQIAAANATLRAPPSRSRRCNRLCSPRRAVIRGRP